MSRRSRIAGRELIATAGLSETADLRMGREAVDAFGRDIQRFAYCDWLWELELLQLRWETQNK